MDIWMVLILALPILNVRPCLVGLGFDTGLDLRLVCLDSLDFWGLPILTWDLT